MKKIAVFPGSFDPVTKGHESIINRALSLFDEIIVAIGINSEKKYLFELDQRKNWLEQIFAHESKIRVETYEGLTVNFCKESNAAFILRGLRTSADFDFERGIAQMNKAMESGIETIFIIGNPEFSAINSTIVRDIIRHGGDATPFLPQGLKLS